MSNPPPVAAVDAVTPVAPTVARRGRPPSARKRAQILEAATEAFLAHGFAATSMDAVATAAGVSKQTVYGHFGDKDHLFAAVVDSAREHAPPGPAESDGPLLDPADLRAGLTALGTRLLAVTLHPRVAALRRLVIFEAPQRPHLREVWNRGAPSTFRDTLAGELADLDAAGHLEVPDPAAAVRQFVALCSHESLERTLFGTDPLPDDELEAIVNAAVEVFLRAHTPRPGTPPTGTGTMRP